jgi:hypothetical protein
MARRYRKKPIAIEAVQWTGDNADELKEFVGMREDTGEPGFVLPGESAEGSHEAQVWAREEHAWCSVPMGHWVMRGVKGEFYACAPLIFAATYDPVDEDN